MLHFTHLLDAFPTDVAKLVYSRYAADLVHLIKENDTCSKKSLKAVNQPERKLRIQTEPELRND